MPLAESQFITILVEISPSSPTYVGTPVTFTATDAPGSTAIFTIDGVAQPPVVVISGHASVTVSTFTVGYHYGGDSSFLPSTSDAMKETVTLAPLTLTVSSSSNPTTAGQSVTFTGSLSGGNLMFFGTLIEFFDGATPLGWADVVNGQATFTTSGLSAGTHSIVARYTKPWILSVDTAQGSVTQTVN